MFFVREICIESVVGVWMKSGNIFGLCSGQKRWVVLCLVELGGENAF